MRASSPPRTRTCGRRSKAHRFRDDLFYRISVVPVRLPPLRERREDIPLLARHFLDYFRRSIHAVSEEFAPETLQLLSEYAWPGNVRELKNIIERMVVLHGRTRMLQPQFLPEELLPGIRRPRADAGRRPPRPSGPVTLSGAVSGFERQLIERALAETGGVQTAAAQLLGTTRRILRYRMHKLNIPPSGARSKT
jgi:transcriptional regulator with GAF, ATPase, and Fis domain